MNTKLLMELAKKAGLKYSSETALSPFEEKFAELIVQECAKVANEHDCNWSGNAGEMLNHFGVK